MMLSAAFRGKSSTTIVHNNRSRNGTGRIRNIMINYR